MSDYQYMETSPMFNLSLGSKELFHSNFLAWLAEKYPVFFDSIIKEVPQDVIDCLSGEPKVVVKREKNHLDLSIWTKDEKKPLFILENKVKSIPSLDQLNKYRDENINKGCRSFLLLTLCEEFPDKDKILEWKVIDAKDAKDAKDAEDVNWKILTYRELCNRMRDNLNLVTDDYHKLIVDDYIKFMEEMVDSVTRLVKDDIMNEPFLLHVIEIASKLRIEDLHRKLWNSALAVVIRNAINETPKLAGRDIKVEQGFSNGRGMLTIEVPISNNSHQGIQIQGNQYRHYICGQFDLTQDAKDGMSDFTNWIADCKSNIAKVILPDHDDIFIDRITQRNDFCKYNDNFKYQYRVLREDATVSAVVEALIHDIESIG